MRPVALWGPVVLVTALIYWASSMSDPGAPPGGLSDKALHVLVYASLGASLIRALSGAVPSRMTLRLVLIAALIGTAYGVSDELHQSFVPHRTPEWLDLVADAGGSLAGAAVLATIARLFARSRTGLRDSTR